MAEKKSWRDYSNQESGGNSKNSKKAGGWREYSTFDTTSAVGTNITNSVNTWLTNHNNFITNYQNRYSGRKYNYEDAYVGDSASWLDSVSKQKSQLDTEADNIMAYMRQYQDYIDQDWMKSVWDTLAKGSSTNRQIVDAATSDNEYWNGFGTEELVNQYGSAEDAYKALASADKKRNDQLNLDTDAYAKEVEDLGNFYDEAYTIDVWHNDYSLGLTKNDLDYDPAEDERKLGIYNRFVNDYGGNLDSVYDEYKKKERYLNEAKQVQSKAREQEEYEKQLAPYKALMQNPDFDTKSAYKSTKTGDYKANAFGYIYDTGYGDIMYDYINRDQNARSIQGAIDTQISATLAGVDASYLKEMTDDEIKIYNSLYDPNDKTASEEFLSVILSDLAYRQRKRKEEEAAAYAKEHPFQSSAWSVMLSPMKAASAVGQVADYIDDGAIDQNAGYNKYSYVSSAIRNQVSNDIAKPQNGVWGKVGSWTYQLGMSMGDFLMNSAISGGNSTVSLALMGSGAMADTVISAKDRGLSDDQAMILGVVAGAAEIVTEKFSLDALFKGDLSKGAMRYILTNAFTEGTEEVSSSLINTVADVLVAKDKSEWQMAIKDYLEKNPDATEKEAFQKVLGDNLLSLGLDFLGGSLMGGSMGSVGAGINYVANARPGIKDNIKAATQYGDPEVQKALIKEGLASDPKSKSYDLAKHYEKKVSKGKSMTGYEIRQLVSANEAQFVVENYEEALPLAKKRLADLGETENIDEIADLVAKRASGQKLTPSEKSTLVQSQYGAKVAKEMTPETADLNYKSLESRFGTKGRFGVSESGKTVVRDTDEEIDIKKLDVATVGNGELTFKVAEDREVSAEGIDFADDKQSFLVSGISNIENITPTAATAMIHDIVDMEKPLGPQLNGIDESFTYGYHGYSEADLKAGNFSTGLTSEQMMSAYKLGQSARASSKANKVQAIKRMRTAVQAATEKAIAEGKEAPKAKGMGITYNYGNGKVVSIDEAEIKTAKQEGGTAVANILLDMNLGTSVEFFSSKVVKDANGNKIRVFVDDNGVEQKAYSGLYRKSDGTIRIDLNAYNGRGLTLNALSHELTHFVQQWSPEKYEVLAEFLVKSYEKTDMTMNDRVLREQDRLKRVRGEDVSYSEAYDEVVANAMAKMFDDGKLLDKLKELASVDKSLVEKILEGIKEFLNKFLPVYEKQSALYHDTADIMAMKDTVEKLQSILAEALVDASGNYRAYLTATENQLLTEAGIGFDEDTRSVYSLHFSTAYQDTIQVGKKTFDTEAIAQVVAKGTGRSIEDARKWVQSEMTIANIVMENPEFLDFEADNRYEAIKKNSDYPQGTVDMSNLCPKREEFTVMFDMLQKKYPNKLFTAQDVADMRKILAENDITVACGACFVEDRRQLLGEIADTFINMWKEAVESGKPLQKTNAAGVKSDLLVTKALAKQYGLTAGSKIMATDTYIPNQYDLTTYEGFKLLEKNHPTIAMGFNRYNNSRGQQSARLIEGRAEYNRQILGWSDAKVRSVNNNGGLRIFSFSDFEVVHLLDLVQVIIDCSARGVKIQGYTKIPAFAKLVRGTGIKLNRSLIPMGDYGFHMENGKVVLDYDTTEGIDINDDNFIDESNNPDVGNIVIGINPTQIGAAMLDPFIDYIIPFHSNKAKEILKKLGTGEWVNYKESQHEKDISTGKASKHNVNIYTEVINKYHPTNKVDFVNAFLKECKRQGKIPRYAEFLNVDANGDYAYREGYHKLLVDFKMFDAEGNILPQGNITPSLDENFMKELLNAEITKKQSYEFPQKVYDAIDKKFGENSLDNSAVGNENSLTENKARGEVNDNRGVRKGTEETTGDFKTDGRRYSESAGAAQEANSFGDLSTSTRKRVTSIVNNHIDDSPKYDDIIDLLCLIADKSADEMTDAQLKKTIRQLAESIYADAMTMPSLLFEDRWSILGGANKLRNDIIAATKTKPSDGEKDLDSDGRQVTKEQQEFFKDTKVVDKNGRLLVMYHGSSSNIRFTVFELRSMVNGRIYGEGYYFTEDKNEALNWGGGQLYEVYVNLSNPYYASTQMEAPEAIVALAKENYGRTYDRLSQDPNWWGSKYTREEYIEQNSRMWENAEIALNSAIDTSDIPEKGFSEELARRKTKLLKSLKYDGVIVSTSKSNRNFQEVVAFDSNQIKLTTNKNPTKNIDMQFSSQETDADNAPTFYSHMAKVVEGMKQEKFGASSVISMLRDPKRGVKAEEIRWSGIQAFLDGKKSVTKKELLDFINSSMLQIEEEQRGSTDNVQKEFVQAWRNFIDQDLDESEILDGLNYVDTSLPSYLEELVENEDLDQYYADYILDLAKRASKHTGEPTKWDEYKLDGGENYRELVFKIPGATYTNMAMQGHWGVEAQGVLAHARMQDFDTADGKRMLFIEEIQSDWHNQGHKEGYRKEGEKTERMLRAESKKAYEEFYSTVEKMLEDNADWEDDNAIYYARPVVVAEMFDGNESHFEALKFTDEQKETIRAMVAEESARQEALKTAPKQDMAPDAPFKENYHEFVLKRLLRMAAEEGYDSIGWTTADLQMDRWNPGRATNEIAGVKDAKNPDAIAFELAYQNLYDRNMRKFLEKYGKQWGSTVGKTDIQTKQLNQKQEADVNRVADILEDPEGYIRDQKGIKEVWSMDITDAMKKSVMTEGQAMYSSQETDLDSNGKQLGEDQLEYFVKSMVRDRNGRLQVVYHGGTVEFEFDTTRGGNGATQYGPGAYFTDSEYYAKEYTWYRGGNVRAYYLNIEKMFDDTNMDATVKMPQWKKLEQILRNNGIEDKFINGFANNGFAYMSRYLGNRAGSTRSDSWGGSEILNGMLREAGFDGIKGTLNDVYQYVIFIPNQAKLTTNEVPSTFYDTRYSEHDTDYSNRSLLANAFEGITQNSDEYKMIQEYKGRIKLLNEQEEKLDKLNAEIRKIRFGTDGEYDAKKLKELEAEAKNVAKNINRHDKKLLALEASEPLRKVIDRERKKEAQKTRDHVKEIQQNKKLRAEQTELRHKIRKTVRDLDKILNRGNKKQNVKEDMKGFVSKALELADYLFTDHISNDELIRRGITVRMTPKEAALVKETEDILSKLYDNADSLTDEDFTRLDAKRKANEDKLRDLLTAQRNERLNTPVYDLFNALVTQYASLKNSKQDAVRAAYNVDLERLLRQFMGDSADGSDTDRKTLLQNMRVADMTTAELNKLYEAYKMVLTNVRDANKVFVMGKIESIDKAAEKLTWDFTKRKIPDKKVAIIARNLANKIGWDYEKLYYALDRIGSETFTELVMNIANSENIVMQDVMEAITFRDEMVKNYGYNNWDVNKEIDREFLDSTGKKFKLTLGQLMALYAYSRREGAWDHIEYGGFVFGEAALTNPRPADSYKLSKEQCEAITNLLTKEQKGYAEDMQKYLSETMGAKGNEVSMLLYGINMFGEKNYFPIHIAGQFKAQANESQAKAAAGFSTMSNAGFTHAQNPNAKAPFVLEGFNEIWADHVNEMSRYHGTVPALEDMRRVMNRSSYSESGTESMAIKQLMENSYGKEAVDYFDNLYREANSGAITDKLQKWPKKLLSLFRKNSVAYSLSVLVQQPASLVRAYAMIDRKYFGIKGFGTITSGIAKAVSDKWTKAHTNAYNEMLKYAPGVTMTKEIGGFDTATGGSIRSYLLDTNKSLKQKWKTGTVAEKGKAVLDVVDDNAIANLPNLADKIAWIEIWNAVKRETIAKHKDLVPTSDEFMQIVGDRFTEVIRATQVYDSIFAKSPMLKSKNLAVQYLVSFMNEPNTVANMAESAVRDATKGDWKSGAKKAAVLIHAIVFTNVLKSLVYALRDDDEDETYIEKYIEAVSGNMMSDFNALNYIPIARDVWSIAQGYDVERSDMAIVSDVIGALNNVIKNATNDTEGMTEEQLIEFDKKVTETSWQLVESLASVFGIPAKNIRREIEAVINTARNTAANAGRTTAHSAWDKIYDGVIGSIPFMSTPSKQDKLYDAIMSGDKAYVGRIKSTYKTEDAYQSAVRKALRENDPRIKQAAQARYEGRTEEYKRIFREIQNERKFSFDDIMSAINTELSKLTPDKVTSDYTASGYVEAIAMGNTSEAKAMKDDIIATKMANGKTQAEAEKEFVSNVTTGIRDAYTSGLLDEAGAKKMLLEYTYKDGEEAASKVSYWAFCEKYPGYDFSESNVNGYLEFAEPAGISVDVYAQFIKGTKGLGDIKDEWGDVEVTKREQVLEVIHALPLTWEQKDALYLAYGYAESEIWNVPW